MPYYRFDNFTIYGSKMRKSCALECGKNVNVLGLISIAMQPAVILKDLWDSLWVCFVDCTSCNLIKVFIKFLKKAFM